MVTPVHAPTARSTSTAPRGWPATSSTSSATTALVINGTTGESPTTTDAEKDTLLRAVVEAVGDRATVVAGVGTNDTRHTDRAGPRRREGRRPRRCWSSRRTTTSRRRPGWCAHFTRRRRRHRPAGDALRHPGPHRRRRSTTETLCRLAEHERIVAVKDAKGDLAETVLGDAAAPTWPTTRARTSSRCRCCRSARSAWSARSTHFSGPQTKQMIEAYERGRRRRARWRLHQQLLPLFTGFFRTQGTILVKAGADAARACRPARCARRWSTRPTPSSPSCATTARAAGAAMLGTWTTGTHAVSRRVTERTSSSTRRRRCREGGLRVIPLGGLGAIGRNMTVFEYDGKLLIVDCGVLFPDVDQPGVDLILPDFASDPGPARRRPGDRAHPRARGPHRRGAVPARPQARHPAGRLPVHAGAGRGEARRAAHRAVLADRRARAGPSGSGRSSASSSRSTTRSRTRSRWPSARRPALVLHTGDFKMDQLPLDGRHHRPGRLRPARRRGRRPAAVGLDQRRDPRLRHAGAGDRPGARRDLRARRPGRIIVASFASHVHRVQQVLDAAARARPQGRASSAGRWCATWASPATSACCASRPAWSSASTRRPALPPDQIVLMSTGSQGEPMSALGRMAIGDHRHVTIGAGDTVVLASSLVPGNETAVYRVINQLSRAGAIVVHKDVAKVHVSGHAPGRRAALPAQRGQAAQLHAGARRVAAPAGARPARHRVRRRRPTGSCSARTATWSTWSTARPAWSGTCKCRYVYVDGLAVGDVGESLLTERRILGDGGFIAATVVVDSVTGKVVGGPTRLGEGLLRGPGGVRPGAPAGHRGAGPGRGRRHHRPAPAAADRPPHRRPLGQRHVPPPPDDRPDRRRGLTHG